MSDRPPPRLLLRPRSSFCAAAAAWAAAAVAAGAACRLDLRLELRETQVKGAKGQGHEAVKVTDHKDRRVLGRCGF